MSEVVCIACGWQAYIVCCSELPLIETVCKTCIMQFNFKGKEKCQSCLKPILHKIAKLKSEFTRQLNTLANEKFEDPLFIVPEEKQLASQRNHLTGNLKRITSTTDNSKISNSFLKAQNYQGFDLKKRPQFPNRVFSKPEPNPFFSKSEPNPFCSKSQLKGSIFSSFMKDESFGSKAFRDAIRYSNEVLDLPPDYDAIIQKERLKIGNAAFAQPGTRPESRGDYFDGESEFSEGSSQDPVN